MRPDFKGDIDLGKVIVILATVIGFLILFLELNT
jgi:hypothetical protein